MSTSKRTRRAGTASDRSTVQKSVRIIGQSDDWQNPRVRAYGKNFGRIDGPGSGGKLIGYARVSTEDQELRMQRAALEAAGCWNIYEEKRSATRGKRPQLQFALLDLRKGDTLVVWKLDRLARNARELYALLDQVHALGANFKSLQEQFDFTTPMGQFVLGILGLVAQLEAQMTAHRTSAGIAALKAAGGSYGALPVLSKAKVRSLKKLRRMRRKGKRVWTIAKLAERFGVSTATVNNYLTGRTRPRT